MAIGVIGKKAGMTSVFAEDGTMVPVSAGPEKPRRLTKPRAGQLKGLPPVKHTREFRLDDASDYQVGQTLDVSLFEAGETVDVTGVSKGRGFSGTVKRHHF